VRCVGQCFGSSCALNGLLRKFGVCCFVVRSVSWLAAFTGRSFQRQGRRRLFSSLSFDSRLSRFTCIGEASHLLPQALFLFGFFLVFLFLLSLACQLAFFLHDPFLDLDRIF
jgi:hypothetical protein